MTIIINGINHECALERVPYVRIVDMGLKHLGVLQRRGAIVRYAGANQCLDTGELKRRRSVLIQDGTVFTVTPASQPMPVIRKPFSTIN